MNCVRQEESGRCKVRQTEDEVLGLFVLNKARVAGEVSRLTSGTRSSLRPLFRVSLLFSVFLVERQGSVKTFNIYLTPPPYLHPLPIYISFVNDIFLYV